MNLLYRFITFMFFAIALSPTAYAEDVGSSEDIICAEVMKRYEDKTLGQIILTNSRIADPQMVDIDNDAKMETVAYFPTRTYMAMLEIIEGKNRVVASTQEITARYSGEDVISISGKNYILHYSADGPFELTEVIENPPDSAPYIYTSKNICKFYKLP